MQTAVVELLIKHADKVGMVEDALVEKTAFMSELFSSCTDDELDASEDNLDDTKESRKKEKKRKRSGSFQGVFSIPCRRNEYMCTNHVHLFLL